MKQYKLDTVNLKSIRRQDNFPSNKVELTVHFEHEQEKGPFCA